MDRSFAPPTASANDRERKQVMDRHTGISNRKLPGDEAREREVHTPKYESPPPPRDAGGATGEASPDLRADQTSHKAGARSIAQKETRARYPDRSTPSSRKVAGAFGKEPGEEKNEE